MASVTVTMGSEAKADNAITAGWIQSRIRALQSAGQPVCAAVRVQGGDINVSLSIGDCRGAGGGSSSPPNAAEREVFDLQRRLHLDRSDFSPGELEAFVKQAMRL